MLALCSCEDVKLSAEDLVDLCSSFVVRDTGLDVFRFAHLSVREFLETKGDYEPDRNHALVAELCLRYLSTGTVTPSIKFWKNRCLESELALPEDDSISTVLVHKHPSKAPAAVKTTGLWIDCHSCRQKIDGEIWKCATLEGISFDYCGDCVEKGSVCRSENGCPLVRSPAYGNGNALRTKDVLDNGKEGIEAEAPISTISRAPIFFDGFYQYSCFFWPFHLSESLEHRLSDPLRSISIDFMIGGQQTASASFVSWSNTMLRTINVPDRTWGYELHTRGARVVSDGVNQPADCIFIAAIWGFCDILELRVNLDPDTVNSVSQREGTPALHFTAAFGKLRAAQILLEKGAMMEYRDRQGYNALDIAVAFQQPEIVRLFLERGADARTKQGSPYPLRQAVELGHLDIIESLLKHGADPEIGGTIDPSALILAAMKGNEDAMKLLIDYLTEIEISTKLLWKMLARIQKVMRTEGEIGLLHSLSTWPTSTVANRLLGIVLWMAVLHNDEACAMLLLAKEADPNTTCVKRSVFDVAVRALLKGDIGQLKFLEMLLAHGANPDLGRYHESTIESLIVSGVNHNMLDLVRLCADTGANLNQDSRYMPLYCPLYNAVENMNVEMVKFLLERGVDPKEVSAQFFAGDIKPRDIGRQSPQDSEEMGKLLLEYGSIGR